MQQTVKKRLQDTFLDLIQINEIYPNEKDIIDYVIRFFTKLQIEVRTDAFNNVIAYIPGEGETIMLNTHLDIPEALGNLSYAIEGDVIRSNGESILGADPKSGLAVLLEFARRVTERCIRTCPIELVFTRGEETGLFGAINLDYSLLKSKRGLVLDEDGSCNNVVIQAPAFYRLDVIIQGTTVHARDWREGKNALQAASNLLSRLPYGEIEPGVSFNIGVVTSGTARNSTPGTCRLEAEMRSFDTQKMLLCAQRVEDQFRQLEKEYGVTVVIDGVLEIESYNIVNTDPFLQHICNSLITQGLSPNLYATFGGSDANIFNRNGIKTLAIGSGYYLAHQYTEYVNLSEMQDLLCFLISITGQSSTLEIERNLV